MPTLMQKIKLAIRGWNRRREEANQAFVQRGTDWAPPARTDPSLTLGVTPTIDMEGLTVAFLDDSGRIAYYLDTETGDVLDVRDGATLAPPRYRRVPARSAESDAADQRAFVAMHPELASAGDFRRELSKNRALERAWYNFKNDRAIAAIEEWLRK
jgi:hypothetical protein